MNVTPMNVMFGPITNWEGGPYLRACSQQRLATQPKFRLANWYSQLSIISYICVIKCSLLTLHAQHASSVRYTWDVYRSQEFRLMERSCHGLRLGNRCPTGCLDHLNHRFKTSKFNVVKCSSLLLFNPIVCISRMGAD